MGHCGLRNDDELETDREKTETNQDSNRRYLTIFLEMRRKISNLAQIRNGSVSCRWIERK
jgi:hypothetical protein